MADEPDKKWWENQIRHHTDLGTVCIGVGTAIVAYIFQWLFFPNAPTYVTAFIVLGLMFLALVYRLISFLV